MNILPTSAYGFISSFLGEKLVKKNFNVIAFKFYNFLGYNGSSRI